MKSVSSRCGFVAAERVVEKLQNFVLKFTYEVTPDPLLCLAVVRVCHEKDLLIGSIQRCLIDAVRSCVATSQILFYLGVCSVVHLHHASVIYCAFLC